VSHVNGVLRDQNQYISNINDNKEESILKLLIELLIRGIAMHEPLELAGMGSCEKKESTSPDNRSHSQL
jgi:hypothetical protein